MMISALFTIIDRSLPHDIWCYQLYWLRNL